MIGGAGATYSAPGPDGSDTTAAARPGGESVDRKTANAPAGTSFRLEKEQIEMLIREAGFDARQRDNWYELLG